MTGSFFSPTVPADWRVLLGAHPGWWFRETAADKTDSFIRVRRWGQGFIVSVYPDINILAARPALSVGRTVIGRWLTVEAAANAARTVLGTGPERVCSPADIDRVRRELAKARAR
jgi:hypothetical protein